MSKDGVEVVFVSADRSPEEMLSYMKESHGDWWAVEHESEEGRALSEVILLNLGACYQMMVADWVSFPPPPPLSRSTASRASPRPSC